MAYQINPAYQEFEQQQVDKYYQEFIAPLGLPKQPTNIPPIKQLENYWLSSGKDAQGYTTEVEAADIYGTQLIRNLNNLFLQQLKQQGFNIEPPKGSGLRFDTSKFMDAVRNDFYSGNMTQDSLQGIVNDNSYATGSGFGSFLDKTGLDEVLDGVGKLVEEIMPAVPAITLALTGAQLLGPAIGAGTGTGAAAATTAIDPAAVAAEQQLIGGANSAISGLGAAAGAGTATGTAVGAATGSGLASLIPAPLRALWDAVPDPVKNFMSGLFGQAFGVPNLSGLMGVYRGKEAAEAMQQAIDSAKATQQQFYGEAQQFLGQGIATGRQDLQTGLADSTNTLQRYNEQARQDLTPWQQGGQQALGGQLALLGLGGNLGGLTPQQYLEQTPGYQWQLGQGLDAVQAQMAARGLSASGPEQQALMKYAQGLASTTFDQRLDQLAKLSGLGAEAGSQLSQQQYGTGQNIGQYQYNTGANLADLAFKGSQLQSETAMEQAQQLGAYDVFGGAEKARQLAGMQSSGNILLDLYLQNQV